MGYNFDMNWRKITHLLLLLVFITMVLTTSVASMKDPMIQAGMFTAQIEYDYISWLLNAAAQKAAQAQINVSQRLTEEQQVQVVNRYFNLVRDLEIARTQVELVFIDPRITDPETAAAELLAQQHALEAALESLAPLVESILQAQVTQVLAEAGIGELANPGPPVLFHSSPLPKALIVSPRDSIQQQVNISLLSDLSMEEISALESEIEEYMDASALVVDVGGIGVYPTMVQRSSSIAWTIDTIAHEWAHNYLSLRPLGMNYDTTPELRTMNETTASIIGSEISAQVMERFYSENQSGNGKSGKAVLRAEPTAVFDFHHEMYLTRLRVDELLAQGKVEEAETYMEQRRVLFVEHGYMIRRLNQAYFAFHGAYASTPGGAAGEDPVGPAVRELRANADSLADFLKQISQMNSFADLQAAINS